MNYVDLDINAASRTPKMRDESVSYAEVIIPKSRKEQANESNQQVNEDKQQIKAATLKVCCNNISVQLHCLFYGLFGSPKTAINLQQQKCLKIMKGVTGLKNSTMVIIYTFSIIHTEKQKIPFDIYNKQQP